MLNIPSILLTTACVLVLMSGHHSIVLFIIIIMLLLLMYIWSNWKTLLPKLLAFCTIVRNATAVTDEKQPSKLPQRPTPRHQQRPVSSTAAEKSTNSANVTYKNILRAMFTKSPSTVAASDDHYLGEIGALSLKCIEVDAESYPPRIIINGATSMETNLLASEVDGAIEYTVKLYSRQGCSKLNVFFDDISDGYMHVGNMIFWKDFKRLEIGLPHIVVMKDKSVTTTKAAAAAAAETTT